jgi:hypothetical protein
LRIARAPARRPACRPAPAGLADSESLASGMPRVGSEFEELGAGAVGDVKYHLGTHCVAEFAGRSCHMRWAARPSLPKEGSGWAGGWWVG